MKKVQIFFIYAKKCKHCASALIAIESAVAKCQKIPCEIKKFHYDNEVSIAIALNKGIDDLPGIVIKDTVFAGKEFSEEKIIEAIKKASKN